MAKKTLTVGDCLNPYQKNMVGTYMQTDLLNKAVDSITYGEMRTLAAILFSSGRFVYQSDINRLVGQFIDHAN